MCACLSLCACMEMGMWWDFRLRCWMLCHGSASPAGRGMGNDNTCTIPHLSESLQVVFDFSYV